MLIITIPICIEEGQALNVQIGEHVQGMCAEAMQNMIDSGKALKAVIPKAKKEKDE